MYVYISKRNIHFQFFPFILTLVVSYHQPKFCAQPSWNQISVTFAQRSLSDSFRTAIFIDRNDTVYIQNSEVAQIKMITKKDASSIMLLPVHIDSHYGSSIFVTIMNDIYMSNNNEHGEINRWRSNNETSEFIVSFCSRCSSIFVDIIDNLYCSMPNYHQVATKMLRPGLNSLFVVAGVGYPASTNVALNRPKGVFVTINLDLYVADSENNRIQLFRAGQLTAITVAGTSETVELYIPTAVTLDADDHLYIVDSYNNRIVASNSIGFRCVIGCSPTYAYEWQRLSAPVNMAFDSNGHIYVTSESTNQRLRKYITATPICSEYNYLLMIIRYL